MFRDPNGDEEGGWVVPTSGGSYWPVYSATGREYLSLQPGAHSRRSALRSKECHFWRSYLPQLLRKGRCHLVSLFSGTH